MIDVILRRLLGGESDGNGGRDAVAGSGGGGGRVLEIYAWVMVVCLTVGVTAVSIGHALRQYDELETGWSWDLAYYNQWYWSLLVSGERRVTVRPMAGYATEGPSIWRMNYLSPLRYMLIPFYAMAPGPRTLLVIDSVVFWWIIPAAYTLVRSETRRPMVALSAAALVPLTPLVWPLAWNDFREIQMALPFVLWGVQGVRSRSPGVTALGVGGMLACRQEMAIVVMSFAFLPPRGRELFARTVAWGRWLLLTGLSWTLAFILYLRWVVSPSAPESYVAQLSSGGAPLGATLETAGWIMGTGMAGWAMLMMVRPRVALLMAPWLWGLSHGRWSMRFLAAGNWHEVRYAAPMVAMGLAAGLVGYAQAANWLAARRCGRGIAVVWVVAATYMTAGLVSVYEMVNRQPPHFEAVEKQAVWEWIGQVAPEDGVLAAYEVTAPLSSRRLLISFQSSALLPPHYPVLVPEIRWLFLNWEAGSTQVFETQGFEFVHCGRRLAILRRK